MLVCKDRQKTRVRYCNHKTNKAKQAKLLSLQTGTNKQMAKQSEEGRQRKGN